MKNTTEMLKKKTRKTDDYCFKNEEAYNQNLCPYY